MTDGRSFAHDPRVRYASLIALLAATYYAAAQIGYTVKFSGAVAAIVWLPVGVGIAFLHFGGLRLWPGVLIGDLLANQYDKLPVGSAIGQSFGNLLEVCLAAFLLGRLTRGRRRPLESVAGVCGVVVAIAAGTAVSATIGPLSLRLGHVIPTADIPHVWRTWWLGDTAGALIVVPFALAWYRSVTSDWRPWTRRRIVEAVALLTTVVGLSEVALETDRPLSYIVFPALTWAALRFGQRGGTLAVAVTAGFTLWKTAHHAGPFVVASISRSTLSTQLFISVAALTTLFLAAVVSEREAFARRLAESRARLVEFADRERRLLEHNLHEGVQQTLIGVAADLGFARNRARQAPDEAAGLLGQAEGQMLVAIEELRELANGIHPAVLTDLGLGMAIRSMAAQSTLPLRLIELPSTRLDEGAEATAYHVVAEAVRNAHKHAHASFVEVRATTDHGLLRVEVVDDGIGGAAVCAGSGLEGLRDRVEAGAGELFVDSSPGRGTRIRATIPARRRP